jgi:addiction module RelE/StbE family toxin
MAKDRKVLWTENAVQDLQTIKDFISQDSPERAADCVLELYSAGESLAKLSHRGRVVPEFNQENIRELIIENYRLVYRVQATAVEILTVFEGHRLLRK